MNHFSASSSPTPLQWLRIYLLYRRSFPRSERKPFSMILSMRRRGKTDVWCYAQDGRFAGFATTINGESLVLLDYLAVETKLRSRGVGSRILRHLKQAYPGRGVFVEIESAFEDGPDRQDRIRRKRFYMKNGMQPARVMASVFGVNMELLCWNCHVDFFQYHAFYRDHYNPWAAEHILEAEYPEEMPQE